MVNWIEWDNDIDNNPMLQVGLALCDEFGNETYGITLENQTSNGWTITDITDHKQKLSFVGLDAEQHFMEVFGQDACFDLAYLNMLETYARALQVWKGQTIIPLIIK